MTAYWPTLAVMQRLDAAQRRELINARAGISWPTMQACHKVTEKLTPCTSMVVIQSEGAGMRRAYLEHPSYEQWVELERGGFIEMWDDFGYVMDVLH